MIKYLKIKLLLACWAVAISSTQAQTVPDRFVPEPAGESAVQERSIPQPPKFQVIEGESAGEQPALGDSGKRAGERTSEQTRGQTWSSKLSDQNQLFEPAPSAAADTLAQSADSTSPDTTTSESTTSQSNALDWNTVITDQSIGHGENTGFLNGRALARTSHDHAAPLIRIETDVPPETSVYKPSEITITLTNEGPYVAESVDLSVAISDGVKLIASEPANAIRQQGTVYFKIGELENGEKRRVTLTIQAAAEGEIQIRPRVIVAAANDIRIRATRPEVDVQLLGDAEITAGGMIQREVKITNTGEDAIRNLLITSVVSDNSRIADVWFAGEGRVIEWLAPGETRSFRFEAAALEPGTALLTFAIEGDNIRSRSQAPIVIAQRTLATSISGPELAYKNSAGTYAIEVANEAPVDAEDLQIILDLPPAMDVQAVDREAHFNKDKSKLIWNIPRLQRDGKTRIPFKASWRSNGSHKLKVAAVSNSRPVAEAQFDTHVIGRASLAVRMQADQEVTEVNSRTGLAFQVSNTGSDLAENVRLEIVLPDSVRAVANEAFQIEGNRVRVRAFELPAGYTQTIRLEIIGSVHGEYVIQSKLSSDSISSTLSSETPVFFFAGASSNR